MANSILTILEPAATNDLTTLDVAKSELDITDNSQDDKIQRWIANASAQVADYLGRTLGLEKVREVFRPAASLPAWSESVLRLSRRPVSSIDSVTIAGSASTDWELDAEKGLLYRATSGSLVSWSVGPVEVVYTAGYDLMDGLPRGIEQATLIMLRHRKASGSRDPYLKAEDVVDVARLEYWVGSTGENGAMPPEASALLYRYRELAIA